MLTLITGVPGSGKTLYAVHAIVRKFLNTFVTEVDDDGVETKHQRIIYTNIKGLKLDHVLIDDSLLGGLCNWYEWAAPGSLIIFDEVQKAWPKRVQGSKVPPWIQELDTHRHMGVDFVFLTQTINNTDQHLVGLIGRHLHVRRIGNLSLALIYEWDHCSRSLQFSKSFAKSFFRYPKSVFKLYKSARVHTVQPSKIPSVTYILVAALIGLAVGVPSYYKRMSERFSPAEVADVPPPPTDPKKPAAPAAETSSTQAPTAVAVAPVLSGCIATAARCVCLTTAGVPVEPDPGYCVSTTRAAPVLSGGNVDWYREWSPPPEAPPPRWTGTVTGTQKGWAF